MEPNGKPTIVPITIGWDTEKQMVAGVESPAIKSMEMVLMVLQMATAKIEHQLKLAWLGAAQQQAMAQAEHDAIARQLKTGHA